MMAIAAKCVTMFQMSLDQIELQHAQNAHRMNNLLKEQKQAKDALKQQKDEYDQLQLVSDTIKRELLHLQSQETPSTASVDMMEVQK